MPIRTLLLALLLFTLLVPATLADAAASDSKSDDVKLQKAGAFDDEKHVVLELKADGIELKAKLRVDDFFKKTTIFANADVHNTSKVAKHYQYYIAFFDAEGKLLGCTGMGSFSDKGMAPGKKTQLGSCLIAIEPADLKKVKSYQAVLYVADQPIGKGE